MPKIHALTPEIIGKIAAGEVVERPASAIKELTENSLDAGATSVTVEIREEPTDYFRVTDNGSGIEPGDLRLAFERHATSKINREEDLTAIMTLGFRGEALSSIAAVSRVTLTTRTPREETGIRVLNEGGQILSIEEAACPTGTTIIVRDLFYNTPVRRKFLKRAATELSLVTELMAGLILSRPDVSFRLISGGRTVFHSPGDGQLSSAIHTVYGGNALKQMRKVEGHAAGMMVSGYVGIGELARSSRNAENFFINHRMMRSVTLSAAVENACRERMMIGKFPMCVLHIGIAYDAVDVNVHPNKLEVRFREEKAVQEGLTGLIQDALRERDAFEKPLEMNLLRGREAEEAELPPIPPPEKIRPVTEVTVSDTLPPAEPVPVLKEKPEPVFREIERKPSAEIYDRPPASPQPFGHARQENIPEHLPEPKTPIPVRPVPERVEQIRAVSEEKKPLRIFGALFNTYILIEYGDQLLLVDQHAVHERLLFDRLMAENGIEAAGQELLVPLVVPMSRREQHLAEENRELLESIGLVMEPFGETDMAVRTLPVVLGETRSVDFIREVMGELENGQSPSFERKRTELLQCACKHAVKGGESLTEDQLRALVEQMIDQGVTPTCPHGRPLVVAITHRELDKKFKRIQA